MNTTFYRAFEDRHRGSRELIAKRLEVYLPFVHPLKTLYPSCPVLDLGCGRGEWLELLQLHGFSPRGVDLDDGMLEACVALHLVAEHDNALSALEALDDNSQAVVSAFHLVEHVPFTDVQKLVSEALRVLKPAGLLIMETPNAENLVVGTSSFFLDPTHEKPVPLDLLSFLTEFSGFSRSKVIRLQEDPALRESQHLTLMDVLGGASPDYAVVAQKASIPEHLAMFDDSFERDYGISLESLAQRYEAQLAQRYESRLDQRYESHLDQRRSDLSGIQAQLVEIQAELQQARNQRDKVFDKQLALAEEQLHHARRERDEALAQAHEFWLKSCATDSAVQALTSSTSWRMTAPLRRFIHALRFTPGDFKRTLEHAPRQIVVVGVRFVLARPVLLQRLNSVIKRIPGLHRKLKKLAHDDGVITDATFASSLNVDNSVPQHLNGLSAEARQIYQDLNKAIDQKDQR